MLRIADSARWADVSIAAMSVRRLSGSAWAALSGPGIHRGAAGNMGDKVLHCRIRLWLYVKAAPLRGAAGPAPAPGSALERPARRTPGRTRAGTPVSTAQN
jgi:hypothetical protein